MRNRKLFLLPIIGLLILAFCGAAFATESPAISRLAGTNRFETACEIAKAEWTQSDYAILAYGLNYPDALAAVPLAKKLNAPILLTDRDSINLNTLSILHSLKIKNLYLIGGFSVISKEQENSLINDGYTVKRIAGQDRYDTAIRIAEELGNSSEIIVATGNDYADALSVAPIAAEKQMPIILAPKDNITNSIQNYINSHTITKVYIIGEQDIISNNVANKFSDTIRIFGVNKYSRNVAVLNKFWPEYDHTMFCFATGENFADALAGAVYAAKNNMAVVLVKKDLTSQTTNFLQTISSSLNSITVFGGETAVPSSIFQTTMNNDTSSEDKLDFGSIYGQVYNNNYFGLSITIPDGFIIRDNIALTQLGNESEDIIVNPSEASNYRYVDLLDVGKDFDNILKIMTFSVYAQKLDSSINNAEEYLTNVKQQTYDGDVVYPKDIYTEQIDGVDFRILDYTKNYIESVSVNGKIYCLVKNGYVLILYETSNSSIDTTDMSNLLSSIHFKR